MKAHKRDRSSNQPPNEASKQVQQTQMQQQLSNKDWEWEKDNYLIKDIKDLLADSNQPQVPMNNATTAQQHHQLPTTPPPPFLTVPQPMSHHKNDSKMGGGQVNTSQEQSQIKRQGSNITTNFSNDQALSRPVPTQTMANNSINLQSQGSFRGTSRDESPNRNRQIALPPALQQSVTNFRHTASTGQMWNIQAKNNRGSSDLKPNSQKRVDPIMQQISEQNNHIKQQQKTQEEFLYQYIKEFQDALAGKEAYKRQQIHQETVNQQKRSRRGGANAFSNGGVSMYPNSHLQQTSNNMTLQDSLNHERSLNTKSELNSGNGQPNANQRRIGGNRKTDNQLPVVDKGWFGITLKIDDKSGFKGHKHLIDKSYPAQQVQVNHQTNRLASQFDESIQQKNSINLNNSTGLDQQQPSKVEDSYFQELPSNPLATVEDDHQPLDDFNSFDNRVTIENNEGENSLLPKIAPENITIQSAGVIDDDENLPPIHFPNQDKIQQQAFNSKYQSQGQNFFKPAGPIIQSQSVRHSQKFHKKHLPPQQLGQNLPNDNSPRLFRRRKSNFISVENQLQQTLQEIEDQQIVSIKKPQVQMGLTGRAAFISKNFAALQNNPLNQHVRGSVFSNNAFSQQSKIAKQDFNGDGHHGRYIGSGGMAIENMSRSLQDPLFDENLNNASLSMSVKSNFNPRGSYYQKRPNQHDDLNMSMSETLENNHFNSQDHHLPSLGLKNNKTPGVQHIRFNSDNNNYLTGPVLNTEKHQRQQAVLKNGNNQRFSVHRAVKKRQEFIGGADFTQKFKTAKMAQSSRVSPGRGFNKGPIINKRISQEQMRDQNDSLERDNNYEDNDYNDFLPLPMDGYDDNFDPVVNDDEILASASMVSSGGFIGDQFHQRQVKQRWKHLESFTNKEVPIHLNSSHGTNHLKLDLKKQPKQFAPISKTNVEWNKSLKENKNIFKKGMATVDIDDQDASMAETMGKNQRMMKSTNFDSTQKRNGGRASESPAQAGLTSNSLFKTKNSQGLIPLNLKRKDNSTQNVEFNVIHLQKVKDNNNIQPQQQDPQQSPQPVRTFSQVAMDRLSRPVVHKQPPPISNFLPDLTLSMRSPRNLSKDNQSPFAKKVGEIENSMSDEEKTKERFESKREEANMTLGDTSLMKNSQSGINLNKTLNAGRKSPNRQSPSRTAQMSPRWVYNESTNKSSKLHNNHGNNANDATLNTNYRQGQIIEFDIEHLLNPLRQICGKKMLCSCNAEKPRDRSVSPKKSPRIKPPPKEEKPKSPKQESPPSKPIVQTAEKSIETIERQEVADVAKMLNDVEWNDTPVFKQHFNIKVTEMESLKGSQIGIRRYKELAKTKGKTMGQIALDLKDDKLRKQLLDQALKNVYLEPECEYLKKITTNFNLNDAQMAIVYEKALDTLEVLMVKLGLDEPFQRVTIHYETMKSQDLRLLLLKVLTRCLVMYDSLGKIEVIFKLMRKRAEHEQKFKDYDTNWATDKKFLTLTQEERERIKAEKMKNLEQDVAQYCYQSCRLWVQISAFTFDHSLLNEFTFKFGGPEYQPLIRKQVEQVRQKFGSFFGFEKIPLMNEDGRLYYDATEGVPAEYVRVGGGFQLQSSTNNDGTSPQRQKSMLRSPSQASSERNRINSSALLHRANSSKMENLQRASSLSKQSKK